MANTDQYQELDQLWIRYKADGAKDARDSLMIHYSALVKYVASRVAGGLPANVEQADLVSYGIFGLIDAIDKFELDRKIKFETYAIPRIKGAILDELRGLDWVPRSVRHKQREFEKAISELKARLKRNPTEPEIAEYLGVGLSELRDMIRRIAETATLSLDDPVAGGRDDGGSVSLMDTLPDHASGDLMAGLESNETRALLASSINALTDREKVVITLYYFEGLTLAEIGDVLGVTESRVCQIHTKAVSHLRERLSDDDED